MTQHTRRTFSVLLEQLENRQLFANEPWGAFPLLIGQDKVAQYYPSLTGAGETVVVIDSGVDYLHPALGGTPIGAGNKVIAGYDFVDNDSNPFPGTNPHGTGIAGVIAANSYVYNGKKYQGIAPGVSLIVLREENSAQAKLALDWVIAHKSEYNIVAVSMTDFVGSGFFPTVYSSELQQLYNAGIFVGVPVGNQGSTVPIENPALSPNVVATGGINISGQINVETQRGPELDMLAPGENVTVPYYDPNTQQAIYTSFATGSSWANAHVIGAVALIKQIDPKFTIAQITKILQDSGKPTFDAQTGLTFSSLDLYAAVQLAYKRANVSASGAFGGAPAVIAANGPTKIEVENYDYGADGVGYHDLDAANLGGQYRPTGVDIEATSDTGAGYDIGWTKAGEWLKYTTYVSNGGTYSFDFRLASQGAGGKFHLEVDGVNVTGSLTVPNTGTWNSWQTLSKTGVHLNAGQHVLKLVFDTNGAGGFTGNFNYLQVTSTALDPPPAGSTPYSGAPAQMASGSATTIEAENFDNGGDGVAYHDLDVANLAGKYRTTDGVDIESTTDIGGGFDIAFTKAGEWMNYTVNVATNGSYTLGARVASLGAGGTFHFEIDGVTVGAALSVPNTAGWQTWTTVSTGNINLTAGQHILKIAFDTNGATGFIGNLNYLKVTPVTVVPPSPPPPSGSTPYTGTPVQVSNSAATTVEIENFDNGGEGVAFHDTDTANNGGKYRTTTGVDIESTTDTGGGFDVAFTKAGEWMNYTVNVATAGSYSFGARVASLGAGGTFHIEIDGVNVSGALSIANTGGWQNWTTINTGNINLTAGQHVLKIALDTNGSTGFIGNLNYLKITPVTVLPPSPPPPASIPYTGAPIQITNSATATIEVENYDLGGEGVAFHDSDSTNTGGKYRTDGVDIENTTDTGGGRDVGWTTAGEWMGYSVNVVNAGSYTFAARVASLGAGGTFHIEIDGVNVTGAMTVPNTGGWQTFTTVNSKSVNLTAGTHMLKLVMESVAGTGFVGNFNNLKVTAAVPASTPYTGTAIPVSPSVVTTIEAENFDNGGEGLAFHDTDTANNGGKYRTTGVDIETTTDAGGGFDIGFTKAGEWLNYSINATSAGTYDIGFRMASAGAGGKFHLEVDGLNVTGSLTVPNTGGWQTFTNVTASGVHLSSGQHVLKVVFDTNGATGFIGNFNKFQFTPVITGPANGANVNASKSNSNETETKIAINPANPNNIIAVSQSSKNGGTSILVMVSTNGGSSYSQQFIGGDDDGLPTNTSRVDARVAFDSFGNAYITYLVAASATDVRIMVGRSSNGGASWSFVSAVSNTYPDAPSIATGVNANNHAQQVVYISYNDGVLDRVREVHMVASGLGNWGNFSAPTTVSENKGNESSVAISSSGAVAIAWQNPEDGIGPATLFLDVDADGPGNGTTFGADKTLLTTHVGGATPLPSQPSRGIDVETGIAFDNSGGANDGRLYLVYTDSNSVGSADTDILFKYSDDLGGSWSTPVFVNDDIGNTSQFIPAIAVDKTSGDIAITWYDARNSAANNTVQMWGAISTDGGITFQPNFQVSAGISSTNGTHAQDAALGNMDFGDVSGLAFNSGKLIASWADNSNSTNDNPNGGGNMLDIVTGVFYVG